MYIDTSNEQFGRITLNAATADKIKNKLIFKSNGSQIGEFDGSTEVELELGDIIGGGSGGYLPLSGGTLTGNLTLQRNLIFTENESYGQVLPDIAQEGQVFFMPDDDIYVPAGGTVGQVLAKNSNTDGDITWTNLTTFVRTAYCETAADVAEKIINFDDGINEGLKENTLILISFAYTNSATNVTFNINNSGAKSIMYNKTYPYTIASTVIATANLPILYLYDGEKYIWISHNVDYNSTGYLPLTGGTVTGDVTIKKATTIVNNHPATLQFQVNQTDNNLTSTASIKVYDDHDANAYGTTMVIQSSGAMIIGSGEAPNSCYTNDLIGKETEQTYIVSDGNIYFYTNCNTYANKKSSVYIDTAGKLYGAVWNDYAEYRELKEDIEIPYGHIVIENGDDTLSLSTKRLQGGGNVCSDTFGFAIGKTEKAKMPIAVSGRALVYTYEDRNSYEPGDAVCTGPEGTVSKMTREEIKEYPDRIIGYVSAIPSYDIWGENNVKVNGRIWIKVV